MASRIRIACVAGAARHRRAEGLIFQVPRILDSPGGRCPHGERFNTLRTTVGPRGCAAGVFRMSQTFSKGEYNLREATEAGKHRKGRRACVLERGKEGGCRKSNERAYPLFSIGNIGLSWQNLLACRPRDTTLAVQRGGNEEGTRRERQRPLASLSRAGK